MNIDERLARLDRAVKNNEVKRGQWQAYLLSQLSPEAEAAKDAAACPADVMPAWLAILTPKIDDECSLAHWPDVIRRYASLAHQWHVLTPAQWTRLDYRCRAIAVREAMRHTTEEPVIAACNGVLALLDRAGTGGEVSHEEWAEAEARAARAARAEAAAAAAAWDRMIDAWLDAIEQEIARSTVAA